MHTVLGRTNLKTLYLLQILLERTDEDHALNASQLIAVLRKDYDIEINRQTVYSEVAKLQDFGLDILQKEEKLGGYYVASRQFELPELKLLVDAVQASKFITRKKSRELIAKLEGLCSREEARQLAAQVTVYNRVKTPNETIYYNVDMLHLAIYRDRQITFRYAEWTVKKKLVPRHDGALYTVSPLHLVWDDENYYLIGYDEDAGRVKHYRVDKMRDMALSDAPRSEESGSEVIDLPDFEKKTFGMFGGQDEQVRLLCDNALAGVVLDRFGADIWMVPKDGAHFAASVTVTVSPQFFGWLTAMGDGMRIEGPAPVRDQYRAYLEKILQGYG